MTAAEEVVMCSGGCGKHWPLSEVLEGKCPWELLQMKMAVRCWECGRALAAAGQAGGGVEAIYQDLASTDRGALRRCQSARRCTKRRGDQEVTWIGKINAGYQNEVFGNSE